MLTRLKTLLTLILSNCARIIRLATAGRGLGSRLIHVGVALAIAVGLVATYSGRSNHDAPVATTDAPPAERTATPDEAQPAPSEVKSAEAPGAQPQPEAVPSPQTTPKHEAAPIASGPTPAPQPVTPPQPAAETAQVAPEKPQPVSRPSFQDRRPIAPLMPEGSQAAAPPSLQDKHPLGTVATAPVASPPATAPPMPAFRDTRPLTSATVDTPVPPNPDTAIAFRDTRPLASAPSFRDARPVEAPSFRDPRSAVGAEPRTPAALPPSTPQPKQPEAVPPAPTGPTLVTIAPPTLKVDAGACRPPEVATEALDGGMMGLHITAECHPNETVQISYAGAEFLRKLSPWGALDFTLDCFAGTASAVEIRFPDGGRRTATVAARDLDKVSKIAVLWRAPVNLDLHVFEYAARLDQPGHLWAKQPSSIATARLASQTEKRGHGFLSTVADDQSLGDKVEVYTFLHNDEQSNGQISLALDYETRGEKPTGATCGQGALAEVDFQVVIQPRGGQFTRQAGVLTRVECGVRIASEARFNQAALPGLRIRR